MNKRSAARVYHSSLLFVILCASWAAAQDLKVLTVDDYDRWNTITSVTLSADGSWMSYAYSPLDGDDTLYLKQLDGETVHEIAVGSAPRFSQDGKWAAYVVSPPQEETEKLQKANKPVVRKLELLNLQTGDKQVFESASSASVSENSQYVAIKKNKTDRDAEHDGTDLIVVELASGMVRNIGNVASFEFNKPGELLALTIDAADQAGNGLYLLEPATGLLRPMDTANAKYSQLEWNDEGDQLAVLRGTEKDDLAQKENDLIVINDPAARSESRFVYAPVDKSDFPAGVVISEFGSLSFSEDGSMVFLGLKEQTPKVGNDKDKDKRNGEERPNVDVWHWKDDRVQSVQMRRAERDRRATMSAVVHLDSGNLVQLADDPRKRVAITGKGRWGVCVDDAQYRSEISWGGRRADYSRVDLKTGEHQPITSALGRPMGYSPDGKWMLFLKGEQLWVHDLDAGTTTNLSKSAPVNFVNEDDDHPYEKPSYGVAGWTSDGDHVIVNHKYDLWLLPLDGGEGRNLTGGVGDTEQIRFRYTRLDPEEETIDTGQPMLLSAYGDWTKKSGYYTLPPGESPQPLIFEEKSIGRATKARDADRITVTMQTFEDYPNYWVTNTRFENPTQVTDANPQQAEYVWGRRMLVDYTNGDGVRLQATLTLPGNYQEGTKYPMLVYFYEKMSQRHHQYSSPRYDDRPHMCTYASDGYLVLMPDVVYKTGRPGSSALDCVTSAVQAVIDMGYVDPDRIVLQGHSWGGYQSSFILTQTDMFAAVVTGAPVTNLVSFYNELYKSSGTVQQGITEKGQVRMGTTPWENMELFHSQSPVHNVRNITTPFIILHGTDDGAVDWHQGLEYYNAARRHNKPVILLSYPGEGHHLGKRANQIDFQIRMKQFFDHYAKGTEAPSWMTDGVPHLEKDTASPRPEQKDDESEAPDDN